MTWSKLTRRHGKNTIWINLDNVYAVEDDRDDGGGSIILWADEDHIEVDESPNEVLNEPCYPPPKELKP